MACYAPLQGWRGKSNTKNGKRPIVFKAEEAYLDLPVSVPCGQCIGCRLERSRQWAIRCIHEAQLHEDNCFITLTYDDEHVPHDRSLDKSHHQKFMKRLRKHMNNKNIKYFHCGEYGEQHNRPHYHTILFGVDFYDRELMGITNGHRIWKSETLDRLWGKGMTSIGDVTFETAAYVARYCMKKVTGDEQDDHYRIVDPDTGEIHQIEPEYATMSRRPGIATEWFNKYRQDLEKDYITINRGAKARLPKFYDKLLEQENPKAHTERKRKRLIALQTRAYDNTPQRLEAREKVKQAQINHLKRGYENER